MKSFYLLISRFICLFITLFSNKFLANSLEIDQFGIYKLSVNIITIINFIALPGAPETLSIIISKRLNGGRNLLKRRFYIILIIIIILVFVSLFIKLLDINFINFRLSISYFICLLILPLFLQIDIIYYGLLALKNYKYFNIFTLINASLFLLSSFLISQIGIFTGFNAALLNIFLASIPSIYFCFYLYKNSSTGNSDVETKKFERKQNLTKLPQILFNFDLIIFGIFNNANTVGEIAVINVFSVGLKALYGVFQNRLSNFLYKSEISEIIKLLKNKFLKIYLLIFVFLTLISCTFIIPILFKLVFAKQYYYVIPYVIIYCIFYLLTAPPSLLSIPLKIKLGIKDNFLINSGHPLISVVLVLLLSRYGLDGYLLSRIALMLIINGFYLNRIKKYISKDLINEF